jgi:hypothetical protein
MAKLAIATQRHFLEGLFQVIQEPQGHLPQL